ncbi:MAG: hypothetical protein MUE85_12970 [Microscillaceae bacterium]|nr:hypothetical protein [Microscillaceae bacterium]
MKKCEVAHAGAPAGEALYTTAGNRAQIMELSMFGVSKICNQLIINGL